MNRRKKRYQYRYEVSGGQVLKKLREALKKEPWAVTVINLAWTAGPVSYLALQAGYFVGYGRFAPWELVIYFGMFTLVAGLIGVSNRLIYHMMTGDKKAVLVRQLEYTLAALPELALVARNQLLASASHDERRHIIVRSLLEDADAEPAAIAIGVSLLTDNQALVDMIRRIEIYRRHGLMAAVPEETKGLKKQIHALIKRVQKEAPLTAALLKQRFSGIAPSKKKGTARRRGFIKRMLLAGEVERFELIDLRDAEEVFILVAELLTGRVISHATLAHKHKSIALTDKEKLALVKKMRNHIPEEIHQALSSPKYYGEVMPEQIKILAYHLLTSLKPVIPIDKKTCRRIIEHSPAANLRVLESGLSVKVRIAWTEALVYEVAMGR